MLSVHEPTWAAARAALLGVCRELKALQRRARSNRAQVTRTKALIALISKALNSESRPTVSSAIVASCQAKDVRQSNDCGQAPKNALGEGQPRSSVFESAVEALPELTPEARFRVRTAVHFTADLLIGRREEFQLLVGLKRRDGAHFEAALKSFLRADRDIRIAAQRHLFDAVAVEYQSLDKDANERSKRLRTVVLPFVQYILSFDADIVEGDLRTRVAYWERGPTAAPTETPAQIVDRISRAKGWSPEELAQRAGVGKNQVYKIKQGKDVNAKTLRCVAGALGCKAGDLLLP